MNKGYKDMRDSRISRDDLHRLHNLNVLFSTVLDVIDDWDRVNPDATKEDREAYRDHTFSITWDLFWHINSSITVSVDYYDPDTTCEEDMRARLDTYNSASQSRAYN